MYRVLARTWRPQRFDELVGQHHIARALANAVESRRLAHAYIFAGVRGIGKTTVARILAKCLNCQQGPTTTPCNECASCREIIEGRSMDVLELDAASRTGVDDIRELQEIVSYAPARDRSRILILDEFHMLSKNAFNALLKTLEEPPPGVVFILATTELQKILPTVLSRCQILEFHRVATSELSAHLRKVCDTEGVEISDAVLARIARAGEGSVRDALSILERVLAFCGTAVREQDALHVLGAVGHEVLEEFVGGLAARDAARLLTVLDGLVRDGHDLVHFWGEIVAALRDLILLRVDPERTELLSRTADQGAALARASDGLSQEDLVRAFQIVSDLETPLRSSAQPRFLFEAALVRLAGLGAVKPIEELLSALTSQGQAPPPPPALPEKKKLAETARVAPKPAAAIAPPADAPAAAASTPDFYPAFVEAVHGAKPMLGAILDEAQGATLDGNVLVIRFGDGAGTIRKRLENPDSQTLLRRVAAEVSGYDLGVRISDSATADSTPAADDPRIGSSSARSGSEGADLRGGPPGPGRGERDTLLEQASNEPGVKKLLLEFGAHVVDIRPMGAPGREGGSPTPEESR
jgi:DNA polymerase-3 subunit gamma/tau